MAEHRDTNDNDDEHHHHYVRFQDLHEQYHDSTDATSIGRGSPPPPYTSAADLNVHSDSSDSDTNLEFRTSFTAAVAVATAGDSDDRGDDGISVDEFCTEQSFLAPEDLEELNLITGHTRSPHFEDRHGQFDSLGTFESHIRGTPTNVIPIAESAAALAYAEAISRYAARLGLPPSAIIPVMDTPPTTSFAPYTGAIRGQSASMTAEASIEGEADSDEADGENEYNGGYQSSSVADLRLANDDSEEARRYINSQYYGPDAYDMGSSSDDDSYLLINSPDDVDGEEETIPRQLARPLQLFDPEVEHIEYATADTESSQGDISTGTAAIAHNPQIWWRAASELGSYGNAESSSMDGDDEDEDSIPRSNRAIFLHYAELGRREDQEGQRLNTLARPQETPIQSNLLGHYLPGNDPEWQNSSEDIPGPLHRSFLRELQMREGGHSGATVVRRIRAHPQHVPIETAWSEIALARWPSIGEEWDRSVHPRATDLEE